MARGSALSSTFKVRESVRTEEIGEFSVRGAPRKFYGTKAERASLSEELAAFRVQSSGCGNKDCNDTPGGERGAANSRLNELECTRITRNRGVGNQQRTLDPITVPL